MSASVAKDCSYSAYEPMQIVHGRTSGFFKTLLWSVRFLIFLLMISSGIKAAMALSGFSVGAALPHIGRCIYLSSVFMFIVVRSLAGLENDATELAWVSCICTIGVIAMGIVNVWMLDEFDLSQAVMAVTSGPQLAAANVVGQFYFDVCGASTGYRSTVAPLSFVAWLFSSAVSGVICASRPSFNHLVVPLVVHRSFDLFFMLLAHGFVGQVVEWTQLSSELLETAFDATFLLGSGETAFVNTTSDRLDDVFHRGMQGCALDDTIVINGVEATTALCKTLGNEDSGAQSMAGLNSEETLPKKKDPRRAFVTCRDAHGWEFDAELRTAPQLKSKMTPDRKLLCGMIVFGEKRPPLDALDNSAVAVHASADLPVMPMLADETSLLEQEGANLGIRNALSLFVPTETDIGNTRRVATKSLPSIPEDQVSHDHRTVLSEEESAGSQVDNILDILAKLCGNARAAQDQVLSKRYRLMKTLLEDSILDLLIQTQTQLPCKLDGQAEALAASADEAGEQMHVPVLQSDMIEEPSSRDCSAAATLSSQVRLRPSAAKQRE